MTNLIGPPPKETVFLDANGRITEPWVAWLGSITAAGSILQTVTINQSIAEDNSTDGTAADVLDTVLDSAALLSAAGNSSDLTLQISDAISYAAEPMRPVLPLLEEILARLALVESITGRDAPIASDAVAFVDPASNGWVQRCDELAAQIAAGDPAPFGGIPILNQDTTGTAANVTGVVALVNGGTGTAAASAAAALTAIGGASLSVANVFNGAATFASSTQTQFNVGANIFNGPLNLYGPGAYVQVINGVAATATVPQAGEGFYFAGQYWTGTASAVDQISFSHTIGAGANPYVQLNITHVGSTGYMSVVCPGLQVTTTSFFTGVASFTVAPIFTDQAGTRAALSLVASAITDTTNAANIASGTLPAARLPVPSATTLGGVQSFTAVANQFLTSVTVAGVHVAAQPAFSNLSGTATAAQTPLAAILAAAQTFAATQTFSVAPIFTAAAATRTALGLGAAALLATPIPIASGGTGQTTAAAALTALVPAWTSYTPAVTAGGSMTISGLTVNDAQYITIGPLTYFKVFVSFTTGGTANPTVSISLPAAVAGGSNSAASMMYTSSVSWSPGCAYVAGSSASCFMLNAAAWYIGGVNLMISGTYRTT